MSTYYFIPFMSTFHSYYVTSHLTLWDPIKLNNSPTLYISPHLNAQVPTSVVSHLSSPELGKTEGVLHAYKLATYIFIKKIISFLKKPKTINYKQFLVFRKLKTHDNTEWTQRYGFLGITHPQPMSWIPNPIIP